LIRLQRILNDLKELETDTKELQKPTINLYSVWNIFDATINAYPSTRCYLDSDSNIVDNAIFERAIVKVIEGLQNDLKMIKN